MTRDEVYNFRWDLEMRDRVKEYARKNNYDDMASVIREAINEKIDPRKKELVLKDQIRLALYEDPSLIEEVLHRIGVEFHVHSPSEQSDNAKNIE